MLLSMTKGNVYEAMQLEESLTEEWFYRYQSWIDIVGDKDSRGSEET